MGRVVLVVVVTALRVMILKAIDTTSNRFEIKEDVHPATAEADNIIVPMIIP